MQIKFPIQALMEEVQALMPTIPMQLGQKYLFEWENIPCVIFIPTAGKPSDKVPTRPVGQHRTLIAWDLACDIVVRGEDYAQVWSVANNLGKVMHDCAMAELKPQSLAFIEPSESQVQHCEHMVFQVQLPGCFQDVLVDTASRIAPDVSTVVASKIVADAYSSPYPNADGEFAFTLET